MVVEPRSSTPTIIALPGATEVVPASNVGESVVDPPLWMIDLTAVRLVEVARGTTLIVVKAVTGAPLEGDTVSVYTRLPFAFPVTPSATPLAIDVPDVSVPLHEVAQETVPAALPLAPLP